MKKLSDLFRFITVSPETTRFVFGCPSVVDHGKIRTDEYRAIIDNNIIIPCYTVGDEGSSRENVRANVYAKLDKDLAGLLVAAAKYDTDFKRPDSEIEFGLVDSTGLDTPDLPFPIHHYDFRGKLDKNSILVIYNGYKNTTAGFTVYIVEDLKIFSGGSKGYYGFMDVGLVITDSSVVEIKSRDCFK